ncbi:hypothetical protein AAFF_G00361860 [Aldrovandia affinis]|uniref:Uncharacterized protein n=1 Tax=Aldrovandia affinis TaxID=143900 RepID=A0AAD7SHU9_9TELE|nr:hypothetical protein AAFF_G00361860 [Aldrovandia affinis]
MSPVAKAIDILQAETNIQMGWLLPTLTQLKTKLDRIKPSLKFSKPLVDAIQLGLKNRFSEILEDPELIAAAILLLKFKTSWTKDEAILKKDVLFTSNSNTIAAINNVTEATKILSPVPILELTL